MKMTARKFHRKIWKIWASNFIKKGSVVEQSFYKAPQAAGPEQRPLKHKT